MTEFLVKNKTTNKYYNFVLQCWTKYPTFACLTNDINKINKLAEDNHIEVITHKATFNNSIVDQVITV